MKDRHSNLKDVPYLQTTIFQKLLTISTLLYPHKDPLGSILPTNHQTNKTRHSFNTAFLLSPQKVPIRQKKIGLTSNLFNLYFNPLESSEKLIND